MKKYSDCVADGGPLAASVLGVGIGITPVVGVSREIPSRRVLIF